MKILLIEDDEAIISLLTQSLTAHRYVVDAVRDGETGWVYGTTFEYDLIVMDIMLPKVDGMTLCRRFRAEQYTIPIVLLTAQDSSMAKIQGLNAGADDCMIKPFDVEELIARIRALLRRCSATPSLLMSWGDLLLDPVTCEVTYNGQLLNLTTKEYELIELLLQDSRHVMSNDEILDRLWSSNEFPAEATVRSHIRRLRYKLQAAGAPHDFIGTLYGRGYYLKSFDQPLTPLPIQSTSTLQMQPAIAQYSLAMLIIGADAGFTQSLAEAASQYGIKSAIAPTLEVAYQSLTNSTPDVIVLRLSDLAQRQECLHTLADYLPKIPILTVGNQDSLTQRLEVSRWGGTFLREQSVTFEQIVTYAMGLVQPPTADAKVMFVDDDDLWLRSLPALLEPWRFKVTTLSDPQQFWHVLQSVSPDALVLDIKMPEIDGLALCQVLRSDPQWQQLPVLFVSALEDAKTQNKAFVVGADDYLCKPVMGDDLASRILNRLRRIKSLTGVAKVLF